VNRTVAALLGAAASMGALPPLPIRHDRSRPESPEVQALIQQRAAAKRARRAQAYRRAAELTELGREAERLRCRSRSTAYLSRTATRIVMTNDDYIASLHALDARRRQP
jgi:hypothetical protein